MHALWSIAVLIPLLAGCEALSAATSEDGAASRSNASTADGLRVPASARNVAIVGGCEGCEGAFDGLPEALHHRARIAPEHEPGERMLVTGQVTDRSGRPRAGVILYAYQTDAGGLYPSAQTRLGAAARRHGRLRGWVMTDAQGRYALDTIRPGSYPNQTIPQHIHLHVIEPGCATYYIDDVMFRDDPKLTPAAERQLAQGRGGNGVVAPRRADGVWQVRRDIVLGLRIPGYRDCGDA